MRDGKLNFYDFSFTVRFLGPSCSRHHNHECTVQSKVAYVALISSSKTKLLLLHIKTVCTNVLTQVRSTAE